jgi:AcrR family transcriptional regulator
MSAEEASGASSPELSLRESKKRAARHALSLAALHLATERGLDQLRVDDIAAEAGVSPRTFNNYFSSKEEAICAFNIERQERLREAVLTRPPEETLWEAVINSMVEQNSQEGAPPKEYIQRVRLLVLHPSLQGEFLKSHARTEAILADAIAKRAGIDSDNPGDTMDYLQARLMAGAVGAATRIAMHHWLYAEGEESFLSNLIKLLHELAGGLPTLNGRSARSTARQPQIAAST